MCSEKTIYNYIDSGLFDVRNIDLPRKVKYRQRRKEKEFKVDRACRNGRTYEDFKKYMEKNPEVPLVQMDSVVGKKGGKVLLTVHFVDTSLMLAYIRDANTAKTVTDAFRELRKKLNNRSPYEAFSFCYGETVLAKLGCTQVSPGEIILKPSLLK